MCKNIVVITFFTNVKYKPIKLLYNTHDFLKLYLCNNCGCFSKKNTQTNLKNNSVGTFSLVMQQLLQKFVCMCVVRHAFCFVTFTPVILAVQVYLIRDVVQRPPIVRKEELCEWLGALRKNWVETERQDKDNSYFNSSCTAIIIFVCKILKIIQTTIKKYE